MISVKKFVFSPFSENTYILFDETKECVIIDAGCYTQAEKETLKSFIVSNNLKVISLLQTHAHLDHVFGAAYVKRNFNVKMYLHKLDIPILADVEKRCQTWEIEGYEPVEADEFIEEGDIIKFGNSQLEVIHVPGHAPGHVAFISHADKLIMGGDCLFKNSIGRTDFPLCSHTDLINSIKNKVFMLPDDYVVYAGHMDETTIGFEKKTNPYLK
jgi:hydroxyacylglutathione hydrolase